jgi:hypothetical protein
MRLKNEQDKAHLDIQPPLKISRYKEQRDKTGNKLRGSKSNIKYRRDFALDRKEPACSPDSLSISKNIFMEKTAIVHEES